MMRKLILKKIIEWILRKIAGRRKRPAKAVMIEEDYDGIMDPMLWSWRY